MKKIATFAQRIKEYRTQQDLTLSELSKKIGIAPQTINRYELEQRIPKIDMANHIAQKLQINSLWLQGYDVPLSPAIAKAPCFPSLQLQYENGTWKETWQDASFSFPGQDHSCFWFQIENDSMAPYLLHQDFVCIQKDAPIQNGDLILACYQEKAGIYQYVKEKDSIALVSLNPAYGVQIIPLPCDSFHVYGKAIQMFRSL